MTWHNDTILMIIIVIIIIINVNSIIVVAVVVKMEDFFNWWLSEWDFDIGSVVTGPFSQEHGGLLLPSCQIDA